MEKGNGSVDIALLKDEHIKDLFEKYNRLLRNYGAAIREVKTKLEILDEDFELLHEHNPIHHMDSRLKSPQSLIKKLERKGLPLSIETITGNIFDVAGIRVICHYIEDIYMIAGLLSNQTDITVIETKDYIKNPKPNGYRSLHLVVKVPVFFVDGVMEMPVEVQIRTIAMDFWASLEHKLRYKSEGEIPQFIAAELQECAETINESDLKMQKIHSFLKELDDIKGNNGNSKK